MRGDSKGFIMATDKKIICGSKEASKKESSKYDKSKVNPDVPKKFDEIFKRRKEALDKLAKM
jgi:hypothetical protein